MRVEQQRRECGIGSGQREHEQRLVGRVAVHGRTQAHRFADALEEGDGGLISPVSRAWALVKRNSEAEKRRRKSATIRNGSTRLTQVLSPSSPTVSVTCATFVRDGGDAQEGLEALHDGFVLQ